MEALLGVLLLIVVLVGVPAVLISLASWVLLPVVKAGKRGGLPPQFTLADFFCLFVLIQGWMALVHSFLTLDDRPPMTWVFDIFGWVSLGLLWWTGARTLSRAGIRKTWKRSVFLVLIIPYTFLGPIVVLILPLMIISEPWLVGGLALIAEVPAIALLYGCSRFCRWMVEEAEGSEVGYGPVDPRN